MTADQVGVQAVVGGATVHLLQFFNVPKQVCPYISGAVAFLSGIGLTLKFSGDLATGGNACFYFPAANLLLTSLLASVGQWVVQEGWYQKIAKPPEPTVVVANPVPAPRVAVVAPVVKP